MNLKPLAALLLFACVPAFAQSAGGVAGLSGEVKDPSGSVVPNAKVVISTESRGVLRTLATNGSGIFSAPALAPGPGYKVTVTSAGFAEYVASDIDLQVGQNLNMSIRLALGQTSTSVEVTAAAQLLDDTKTDVSQVVGTREITDLPINGRRVDSFVLNTPGVTNDATFGLLTFRGVAGITRFCWMATTTPSSSTTRTPGEPGSNRRSPPTRSRSLRWYRRTSRPNTAGPWAA